MTTTKLLSERERRFVDAYCGQAEGNATTAARIAGYSEKSAARIGYRLSKKVHVRSEIERRQSIRAEQSGITQARVLEEVALLAFSDVTHYVVTDDGDVQLAAGAPDGAMRALSSVKRRITTRGSGESREVTREVELRLWDKPGPLKLAGQHVGLFPNKVEHAGSIDLAGKSEVELRARLKELAAKC
jgi:phage terminase small subunit